MARQSGFRKLAPGCIHLRCPRCGRKQSNMTRSELDHPTAYMMELLCENCDAGTKDAGIDYFDKRGRLLSPRFSDPKPFGPAPPPESPPTELERWFDPATLRDEYFAARPEGETT